MVRVPVDIFSKRAYFTTFEGKLLPAGTYADGELRILYPYDSIRCVNDSESNSDREENKVINKSCRMLFP